MNQITMLMRDLCRISAQISRESPRILRKSPRNPPLITPESAINHPGILRDSRRIQARIPERNV